MGALPGQGGSSSSGGSKRGPMPGMGGGGGGRGADPSLTGAPRGSGTHPGGILGHISQEIGNVGTMAGKLPAGLFGFARDALVEGANDNFGLSKDPAHRAGEDQHAYEARVRPFTSKAIESASRTGGRAVNTAASFAPGGLKPSDSQYGVAIREGRLLPTLIEDAANVSIAAAPIAKGLGFAAERAAAQSAAAETAAATAEASGSAGAAAARQAATDAADKAASAAARAHTFERVVRGADVAAGAPARVWTAPISGVDLPARIFGEGARIPGVADAVRASGVVPKIVDSGLGQRVSDALKERAWDKESRAVGKGVRDEVLLPLIGENQLAGRGIEVLNRAAERIVSDPDVMRALIDVKGGKFPLYEAALKLPEEHQREFLGRTFGLENAPSPRALKIASDFVNDRLPQTAKEAMENAWAIGPEQMARQHEQMALAGAGRDGAAEMNPEQVGDVPMQSKIDTLTAPRRDAAEQIRRELEGDPSRGVPGLRADALRARARVPEVNLAEQVSERAVRRVERAGGVEATADFARSNAERLRAAESAAAERAGQKALPGPERDLGPLTAPVERGAVRADRATARAGRAATEAEAARGRIFDTAGSKAAKGVVEDGGLFAPENRARIRPEDITPEAVRPHLEKLDADVRGVAADAAAAAVEDLRSTFDAERLSYKPKRRPMTAAERRVAGITDKRIAHIDETSGEWDWFNQLHPDEQARIRKDWMAAEGHTGSAPDQMHLTYSRRPGTTAEPTIEEAMGEFVRRTREIDALHRVAAGKGTPADVSLVGRQLEEAAARKGVRLDMAEVEGSMVEPLAGKTGNGPKQRLAARADKYAEYLRERTAQAEAPPLPPSPSGAGPAAWEMPLDAYTAEASSLSEQVAGASERLAASNDEWASYTPEEMAAVHRLAELVPADFEGATYAETHRALVEAAQHHEYPVPEGVRYANEPALTREQVHAAAGNDAVRTAEADALDALEGDLALQAAHRANNEPVPSEALAYQYLTAGQKAIYREARARARQVGAEQALNEARQRVVGRIDAAGERAGRRVGQQEGAARALGSEAGRMERTAATAERRLAPKVTESIGDITPEERALVAPAMPAGEEVLGRYERSVTPGAKEAARADLERSMAKPVRAGERRGIAEQKARELERTVRSKERRMNWLEDKVSEHEQHLLTGPEEAAPGKYRAPLLMNQRAQQSLAEMADRLEQETGDPVAAEILRSSAAELPRTMQELQARGIFPEYIVGGTEGSSAKSGAGSQVEQLPRSRTLGSQRMKRSGDTPATFRGLSRKYLKDLTEINTNIATRTMQDRFAVTARSYLESKLETLDPTDLVTRQDVGILLDRARSEDLIAHMRADGFTAWDPKAPFSSPSSVNTDTLFIPTSVFKQYRRWFKPEAKNLALRLLDAPTRGWKHMVLALNPHWNIGNVAGNVLLATVGGGVSPAEMVRYGRQAARLLKEEGVTGQVHFPPRLYGAGMGGELASYLNERGPGEGNLVQRNIEDRSLFSGDTRRARLEQGVRGAMAHPIQSSYNLNSFVDDWGRSTVYLAKKAKGYTEEEAVGEALKAMGDFSRMTPFEKNVARRVLPFYAWSRHVTQLAFRLPLEHPFRVAWTLHLANTFAPPEEPNLPGFLHGSVKVGANSYMTTGGLSPFGDVASLPFTPDQAMRGINPIAKAVGAGAFGINAGKGRIFSRPRGTGPGEGKLGVLAPHEFAYYLGQQTPQTRLFQAATEDPVLRYDTGDVMLNGTQRIPMGGGKREAIERNSGLPIFPTTFDQQSALAREVKKETAARRARERRKAALKK